MKKPQFKKGQKVTYLPTMEILTIISSLETIINSKVFVSCRNNNNNEIDDYCTYYLEIR